jgi:XRE family transcriptional regulator, aerobic/anaerobic benzoate catabolism transcriptional regulator
MNQLATAKAPAVDLAPATAGTLDARSRRSPAPPVSGGAGRAGAHLRSRRGMTRKAVAVAADVSERHLANLEYGTGNASVLVLLQVSQALHCSLTELLGDVTTSSPEWLLIRELLENRNEADLRRARVAIGSLLGGGAVAGGDVGRSARIALIGLRGAGKSTLGQRLADDLGYAFIELSREIESLRAAASTKSTPLWHPAYRRYERRALEEAIQIYPEVVIATPGGLVSDAANFNLLLSHCTTIWLQADPADHMGRVAAQGDMRPMAASREAMEDLKRILAGRSAFYSKADLQLQHQCLQRGRRLCRPAPASARGAGCFVACIKVH